MVKGLEQSSERASEEATDWLIRLQDDPEDGDVQRAFEAWRKDSPLNASAWSATNRTAEIIALAPADHIEAWGPFAETSRRGRAAAGERPANRDGAWGRRAAGLALLAAAACLAFVLMPNATIALRSDHVTGPDEIKTVNLADGSTVTLAPGTAVALPSGAGGRGVELLAGEAFFVVAPDPDRPFHVRAGGLNVTVLGTAFDVRMGDLGAAVAVEHGRVRVDFGAAVSRVSEILSAGEGVRVTWDGRAERVGTPADEIAAWRDRQLIVQDRPLGDVIDQLRHYVPGMIVVTDDDLERSTVTGVYNLANPVEAVRGVARAHGATVREITPWLLVVSAR